jgi:hypothetical protein
MDEMITIVAFKTLTMATPQRKFANEAKGQGKHIDKPKGMM